MPFMILWQPGDPLQSDWQLIAEKPRVTDGAVARRWSRSRLDIEAQLEHTEDCYEISLEGQVIASESHQRSPATRWYTQNQVGQLYRQTGFIDIELFHKFSNQPATAEDILFSALGLKP